MKKHVSMAVMGLILAGITISAEQTFVPPPSSLKFAEPWRPASNGNLGETRIIGTVIDIRQVPVANVRVQLRDLDTSLVEAQAVTSDNGEYEFIVTKGGSYIVEMVLVDGVVVALSNAGSLALHETLQTAIILPGRWDMGRRHLEFHRNLDFDRVTLGSVGSVNSTLVLAANGSVRPVDSGEPVSPCIP